MLPDSGYKIYPASWLKAVLPGFTNLTATLPAKDSQTVPVLSGEKITVEPNDFLG